MDVPAPLAPGFIFDYVKLTRKALLIIDKRLTALYCSEEATQLLHRLYELNIQTGHYFLNTSSSFESEVCRITEQTIKSPLHTATAQLPAGIRHTSVNFLELRAYGIQSDDSKELVVLLELIESPYFNFSNTDKVKQIGEILNRLGDYVWIHNLLVDETWFSGEFNFFIGYASEELKPTERPSVWWSCTHPDDAYMLEESDRRYKNGEQADHCLEYRIIDRHGKERWVLDKGIVIQWLPDKQPAVVIGTHTDITELKKLQLQKAQTDRELLLAAYAIAEEERKFIAGFLNENINQLLAAAHAKLDAGENNLPNTVHNEVQHILQFTIEEIKTVCNQIDPSPLEMFELNDVLKDIVEFKQTRTGKKISLLYTDARMQKKKHYEEELVMVRLFQSFLRHTTTVSLTNDYSAAVVYTNSALKLQIRFIDPLFNKEQYIERKDVKILIGRCNYFNGSVALTKSPADEVALAVALSLL